MITIEEKESQQRRVLYKALRKLDFEGRMLFKLNYPPRRCMTHDAIKRVSLRKTIQYLESGKIETAAKLLFKLHGGDAELVGG